MVDSDKINKLGWESKTSLEEGLKKHLNSILKNTKRLNLDKIEFNQIAYFV